MRHQQSSRNHFFIGGEWVAPASRRRFTRGPGQLPAIEVGLRDGLKHFIRSCLITVLVRRAGEQQAARSMMAIAISPAGIHVR